MISKAEIDGNGNIVIQDSDNSEITINMNNPEEIRTFLIKFQRELQALPKTILDLIESKNTNNIKFDSGANVYLSLDILFRNGISGIAFRVGMTNLIKENRFFNAPFFKLSTPFKDNADTFILADCLNRISFPVKLEYGEVVCEAYQIRANSRSIYEEIIGKNINATIQAVVSTTIGEIYKSNEYKVRQLLENFKYA